MRLHYLLLVLILYFQISACRNSSENTKNSIVNIEAENTQSVIDLKLTQLADSFRLVPLETTNECLLDNNTEFYVGKSYILAYSKSGVYKFSTDGKFVKKLFGSGRGPDEFTHLTLCIFVVDEKKDILYINDQIRQGVYLRYDLKSEQFLEPIKQCFPAFGFFYIYSDSLIIASNLLQTSNYSVFIQNLKGKFVSGITNPKKYLSGQKETLQNGRLIKSDSTFYYYFDYDDTLFKIKENKLIPFLALNFKTPRDDLPKDINSVGDRFIIYQPGAPGFIIICIRIIEDVNLYRLGRTGGEKAYYLLLNNSTGVSSRINSYTDNFIGESKDAFALSHLDPYYPFFLTLLSDKKLVMAYYKLQIENAIEKGLNYKDFPVRINEQLIKLNENLQETDNPILLIGRTKDII